MKKLLRYATRIGGWGISLVIASAAAWYLIPQVRIAYGTTTNSGVVFFGDNSATNQGVLRARAYTDPSTWAAQINGATASTTSFSNWIIAKAAPTREEMTIGILRVNGTLDIQTCTTGCDTSGTDFTNRWNNPGTSATQTCTVTTAFGCSRPFDIGYESLSGRAFVAYADNVAATFYYARWDGSAWTPNSAPGTPGTSNDVATNSGGPTCAGTPKWIRVIPSGDNLADDRSNRAMVLVGDSNSDLCAFYWDGSTFDAGTTLISTLGNCGSGQCFDGNWQGETNFVVNYTNSGVNEIRYNKYVVGTGWGADTQAYTTATAPIFITSTADPTSSRIMVVTVSTGADTRSAVWRADNATDGWTVCASGGGTDPCPDTAIETIGGNQAYPAFERFNGDAIHLVNDSGTTADSSYWNYTAPSTWLTDAARTSITTTDDSLMAKAWGSPNSINVMAITEDVDCKIYGNTWTGAGWNATATNLNNGTTATVTNYSATCPLSTAPGAAPIGIAYDYDFVFKLYSPWQRNWHFYNGTDTASVPTTSLANENVAPASFDGAAGKFRLRINYSERGTLASTDSRKKLQFTSGCNPNTVLATSCTWTDVDNAAGAGIWRYFDPTCTATDCADNSLLTGTVLTGTNASCTLGNGCGTWTLNNNGTGASITNMDHNATIVQEGEWIVEANAAAASTTYYFRIWNNEQASPFYTEQDTNDCGAGAAQCTYPSLGTAASAGPTTDQILRHGNWWSSGVEQSFYWAN